MVEQRASNWAEPSLPRVLALRDECVAAAVSMAALTACEPFGDGMMVQVANSEFEPDVLRPAAAK